MIILVVIIHITHQIVIYEFDANSNILDGIYLWLYVILGWERFNGNSDFNNCGGIQYFGSPNNNQYQISRIFLDLEPHSHLTWNAQFLSIDSNLQPSVNIDSKLVAYVSTVTSQNSICSGSSPEFLHTVSFTHYHNRRTVWILIYSTYGGLISLKLSIIKCQSECGECIENYHTTCKQWKLHQLSFNKQSITQSDGWALQAYSLWNQFSCGGCEYLRLVQATYQTELPPHKNVLIRFFKSGTHVMKIDYLYDKLTITNPYQIEILIKNHQDPLLQLIIYAQTSLIRDFEVFYSEPDFMFQNLNEGCLEQIDDKCLICQEGWIQDEFLENCHSECGDGIIQGQEQCDNLIPDQSCYQCKLTCVENCQICEFGICLQCIEGFIMNPNFSCDPLCGDGNLTPYSTEQCELAVNGVGDGCHDCQFIPIANCKTQLFSICLECELGYKKLDNACFPYCGDQIALQQYEDCVGNLQSYDGCYQCMFECIEDCNICDRGQCILKCEDGFEFVDNDCLSVCGDKIVTKQEDCDDGNNIEFDGCFQCQYSCPENCSNCYHGTCLECNDQLSLISNQCNQQLSCGDGLVQEQEECDDGNYQAADGCNNCLIQQNWVCISITKDSPSECAFVKAPGLVINYINMTQNKQYISIQFNQEVKIYTLQPLSETLKFELSDIDKKHWNSSLYIIQDVGSYLSFGEYVVEIEVYQLLKFRPLLTIFVNQEVANIDNAILDDDEKQITLQYPNYLNDKQKDYSQSLKNFNKYLIYCLSGITIISLLLGSGELFVEIMAILQFQQYLRYINLQYPQNLEIYFSIYDMITIQPLLDFMQVEQFFQFIEIQSNQEYSDGKFSVYKQNSSLIINLSSQIFQFVIFLFLMLLLQWIKRVGFQWIFCIRFQQYTLKLSLYINQKIIFKISQYLYSIFQDLIKLEKFMSFQGLQKALLLNGWDMIFKTLLYTRCIQTKSYIDIVQLIMVCIILLLYFQILLTFMKCNQQFSTVSKNQRFEILSFGRQFFFLLVLIYIQHMPVLQLGLVLLTSLLQTISLQKYRCTLNKKSYIVQMVVEKSVTIFTLSSFVYISKFNNYIYQEKKIILGWIQAMILSTGIIIELISICIESILKFKLMRRKKSVTQKSQLFI